MYKIKQIPEDFMVWEIPDYKVEDGEYAYFWLRKVNYNTIDAVGKIASKLRIPLKRIGFAGTKDKAAVTEQVISIKTRKEAVERLRIKDIELDYIGQGSKPISLGDLKGNRFRIIVRNLEYRASMKIKKADRIPNFFGEQRFSKNNAEIGKMLVIGNFKKAVELIDNGVVQEYMEDNPGDFAGGLRRLALRARKMYVHAYQSLLWNQTAEEYLKTKPADEKIPIIGFGTELRNNRVCGVIRKIINKEGIELRDFIIKKIPEISSEGGLRDLFVEVGNLEVSDKKDSLNKGKYAAVASFNLPKGSYATVVIRHLFDQ